MSSKSGSTYSNILGHNPYAEWFLQHLDIRRKEFGRFRDVSLFKDEGMYVVRVTTRNAGSRAKFQAKNERLARHRLYIRQEVDKSDDTYLHFFFMMPASMVHELAEGGVDLDKASASGDYWLVDNRDVKKIYQEDAAGLEDPDDDDEPQAAEA